MTESNRKNSQESSGGNGSRGAMGLAEHLWRLGMTGKELREEWNVIVSVIHEALEGITRRLEAEDKAVDGLVEYCARKIIAGGAVQMPRAGQDEDEDKPKEDGQ